MVNPEDPDQKKPLPLQTADILPEPNFRILCFAMFTGLAAGFAVNANLKGLFPGQDVEAWILAVSLFAVANAAGRITWGILFDRIRSATAVQANLLCQAAVLIAGFWILTSPTGLQVFAVLTGFNYGGVLVVYVSSAARSWGKEHVGQVYGWLFSANIPASVSPILAGMVYDYSGDFTAALWVVGGLLVAAAGVVFLRVEVLNGEGVGT